MQFYLLLLLQWLLVIKAIKRPPAFDITQLLKTVLFGTYKVTSVLLPIWQDKLFRWSKYSGCLLDNEVKLDSALTVSFIDAGVSCGLDYGVALGVY